MAVFSFHPVKTITSGEGGMVTTRDAGLRDRLRAFRSHGIVDARPSATRAAGTASSATLGFNYRLTDLQAALGPLAARAGSTPSSRGATRSPTATATRSRTSTALELPPAAPPGSRPRLPPVRRAPPRRRARAPRASTTALRERGILCQVHYLPVYRHPWYERTYGYAPGLCPEAERYYAGCLSLPCFPALTAREQDSVVDALVTLLRDA